MEASNRIVNPFSKYGGIQLNGRFIPKGGLNQAKGRDHFESDVIFFCQEIFDHSEHISIRTSGSTGTPKNLTFRKSALIQSASATNYYFGLNCENKALLSLPLAYVAAKLMVVRAIIGEYDLVTATPSSNPLKELDESLSFVPMTPHQVNTVLAESPEAFDKVVTVLLGGGEVSVELRAQLQKLSTTFYVGFGMAETLTHFSLSEIIGENETIYKALPDVTIHKDERGCLVINRPGITDGDLVTNDLIELVEDGFQWLGRIDNLINSGGIKIIPEEVEKLLKSRIDSNLFVTGIPDAVLGQKVALFVEGEKRISFDEITFKNGYEKPREIINLERFLYTESGKIRRKETLKLWAASIGD